MTPPPKSTTVISTYQSPMALEKVLQGLQAQSQPPHEILLADDGSVLRRRLDRKLDAAPRPAAHLARGHSDSRKTVHPQQSRRRCDRDYIVLLDGDCVPHREFIRDHEALARRFSGSRAGAVSSRKNPWRNSQPGARRLLFGACKAASPVWPRHFFVFRFRSYDETKNTAASSVATWVFGAKT